jgi:hypothetical protein
VVLFQGAVGAGVVGLGRWLTVVTSRNSSRCPPQASLDRCTNPLLVSIERPCWCQGVSRKKEALNSSALEASAETPSRKRVFRSAMSGALATSAVLAPVVAATSASAHQISNPSSGLGQLLQSQNGFWGPICAYKSDSIDHTSSGWNGIATTRELAWGPGGCNVTMFDQPYATVTAFMQIQRADNTYCVGAASDSNDPGTGQTVLAHAALFGACGAPASGSKQVDSFHDSWVYGVNAQGPWSSGFHPAI